MSNCNSALSTKAINWACLLYWDRRGRYCFWSTHPVTFKDLNCMKINAEALIAGWKTFLLEVRTKSNLALVGILHFIIFIRSWETTKRNSKIVKTAEQYWKKEGSRGNSITKYRAHFFYFSVKLHGVVS